VSFLVRALLDSAGWVNLGQIWPVEARLAVAAKRISVLFLLLACLLAHADDKSRIIALENSWNQAELHNDAHAVDLLLADEFVMTVADGYTMNKAAVLTSVRDTSYKPEVLQSENMEVHLYGNTAIVTGSYREKGKETREVVRAPGTVHGYLGKSGWGMALRGEPLQCEALIPGCSREPAIQYTRFDSWCNPIYELSS
jgi:hypothetical protein